MVDVLPVVERVCRRRLGPWTRPLVDPQDAAQDAMLQLLRGERDHPGTTVTPGMAVAAARWRCLDASRNARREPLREPLDDLLVHPPTPEPGPVEAALQAELHRRVRGLLVEVLTDRQRAVIFCRIWLELSAEETAVALGTTEGAVRVAQHRAIGRLRCRLTGGAR